MSRAAADNYHRCGQRLDEHLATCSTCAAGLPCGVGDDTAESEYRAWRRWADDDPDAARTAQRAHTTGRR